MSRDITKTEQLVNEFTLVLRVLYEDTMRDLIIDEQRIRAEYAEKFKALTQKAVNSALENQTTDNRLQRSS